MASRPRHSLRQALRHLAVLRERNFRIFFIGYTTSMLGTAMATVALAFAVLEATGSLSDLSFVMAARIVPLVALLLGGGVLGDRLPRRLIMLCSDWLRALTQGALAVLLLTGSVRLWQLLLLAALGGVGEAFFKPSFDGLVPHVVSPARLPDANTMIGLGNSVAGVAGPRTRGDTGDAGLPRHGADGGRRNLRPVRPVPDAAARPSVAGGGRRHRHAARAARRLGGCSPRTGGCGR